MDSSARFKQAILVRLDLGMGRGKIAVQCSHAAVSAAEVARNRHPSWWIGWMDEGQCKIALKVSQLETILSVARLARARKMPLFLVKDKGLTQVSAGTITCLGLGPAPSEIVDPLTGNLSLL